MVFTVQFKKLEFLCSTYVDEISRELDSFISDIDGWIIRSGTTITAKNIQNAKKNY